MIYKILLFIVVLSLTGCAGHNPDDRLSRIAGIVAESPSAALSSLDSISYNELSQPDRHFYDLLTVKARDKAYIRHTSDATILRVIDYYSSHNIDNLYPEALYYGARTYCDMGDSPAALIFFHKALENLPNDSAVHDLKGNILSQTGRLLTELRLYDDAIPYIKEAIRIGELHKDSVNIIHDLQLLGGTYFRNNEYDPAEHYFHKALELSSNLPVSFRAKSRMYLAAIKYGKGQTDSALNLIRNTPDLVEPLTRNNALAYASKIYLQKGLLDSAYFFAYELIHSPENLNKETGYHTLLSPELQKFIPIDTLYKYFNDYGALLEDYHDYHKTQSAINQQNLYNYQRHENERRRAEAKNITKTWWICGISAMCLILAVIVLYYKNKSKKTLLELHIALENASRLNDNIRTAGTLPDVTDAKQKEPANNEEGGMPDSDSEAFTFMTTKSANELREKLRTNLLSLYDQNKTAPLSNAIIQSDAYAKLQDFIRNKQHLEYENPFWHELEYAVLKSSPKFKDNLNLLTQSRLTTIDLHTAMLIKCHIQPSQMVILLNRTKGTIVSRRESLCLKIFGKQLGTKVIDGIIHLL